MNKPLPIKPPRSIKKQPARYSTYSLFDSISPSLDWLNTTKRKHSISLDGSDSTSTNHSDAGFWRRASLPNHHFMAMKKDCDHSVLNVCQDCITKVRHEIIYVSFLINLLLRFHPLPPLQHYTSLTNHRLLFLLLITPFLLVLHSFIQMKHFILVISYHLLVHLILSQ